jgi:intracellular septation protein
VLPPGSSAGRQFITAKGAGQIDTRGLYTHNARSKFGHPHGLRSAYGNTGVFWTFIVKLLFDIFPVLLFFIAFKFYGIYAATATAIIATTVQAAWSWIRHRKIEKMMLISLCIIVVFGGATLLLKDETFIKWKPTVLYWAFAVTLLVSQLFLGKNLMRAMMGAQMTLPDGVWKKVNLSWSAFFVLMGVANLYVALNFSTDAWVNFKLFGGIGLLLAFAIGQALMLSRYLDTEQENEN